MHREKIRFVRSVWGLVFRGGFEEVIQVCCQVRKTRFVLLHGLKSAEKIMLIFYKLEKHCVKCNEGSAIS
jgi:hypothetical protein